MLDLVDMARLDMMGLSGVMGLLDVIGLLTMSSRFCMTALVNMIELYLDFSSNEKQIHHAGSFYSREP